MPDQPEPNENDLARPGDDHPAAPPDPVGFAAGTIIRMGPVVILPRDPQPPEKS